MAALSKGRTVADVLRWLAHNSYCIVSAHLKNPNNAAYAAQNLVGQPVKVDGANYALVESTDEGNATGIVLWDKPIALAANEVTDRLYPVLVRGPAVIDRDSLPTADLAGVAFDTVAELVAAYAALDPPIIPVDQPATVSEQTT